MLNANMYYGYSTNEIMLRSTVAALVNIAICLGITVLIRKFMSDKKAKKHYRHYNLAEDENNSVSYTTMTHNDTGQRLKRWNVDEATGNRILNFFAWNSFHDGYITAIDYCRETKFVKMNIVQLYSELELEPPVGVNIQQDALVEVELCMENIYDINSDEDDYSDYEIIRVQYEQKGDEDILLYKLHTFGGYKEICLKGKNIRISAQIIEEVRT